jgi:hypothetical protein
MNQRLKRQLQPYTRISSARQARFGMGSIRVVRRTQQRMGGSGAGAAKALPQLARMCAIGTLEAGIANHSRRFQGRVTRSKTAASIIRGMTIRAAGAVPLSSPRSLGLIPANGLPTRTGIVARETSSCQEGLHPLCYYACSQADGRRKTLKVCNFYKHIDKVAGSALSSRMLFICEKDDICPVPSYSLS